MATQIKKLTQAQDAVNIVRQVVEQANASGMFKKLSDVALAMGSLQTLQALADKDAKENPDASADNGLSAK